MGKVTGDKARYNRDRRRKLERRVTMRALRTMLDAKGAAAPTSKPAPRKRTGHTGDK